MVTMLIADFSRT